MTTQYRTSGAWGFGKGSPLTAGEVDQNFYGHETRIGALEGNPPVAVSIASIGLSGNQMTVTLTDSSILGPFTIPPGFTFRGEWQPLTHYLVNDWITGVGSLYAVLIDHTSSSGSFDPHATDGTGGGDLYDVLLEEPSNALPAGGATEQVLKKSSSADYATTWGNIDALNVSFEPSTGSGLLSSNVSAALEEIEATIIPNTIVSPTTGQVLTFNGTDWDNEDASVITTLAGLTDTAISSPSTGQVLTYNGTKWNNEASPSARFTTVTPLGTSGSISLDPTLGDVFTIAPTADVTITPSSYPAGAHITLVITTTDTNGYTVNFSGHETYDGDLKLPKQAGVTQSISFVGDGTNFNLVSRAADRQAKVLGTTGSVSVSPTFGGLFTCTPTGDITFNATYAPVERKITFVFTTSGTTSRTMTFGTNFKSTGTLATGTVSGAVFTVTFIGDGTNFNEVARTTAM